MAKSYFVPPVFRGKTTRYVWSGRMPRPRKPASEKQPPSKQAGVKTKGASLDFSNRSKGVPAEQLSGPISYRALIRRGWPKALIEKFLGLPVGYSSGPRPQLFYDTTNLAAGEASAEFQAYRGLSESERRKLRDRTRWARERATAGLPYPTNAVIIAAWEALDDGALSTEALFRRVCDSFGNRIDYDDVAMALATRCYE